MSGWKIAVGLRNLSDPCQKGSGCELGSISELLQSLVGPIKLQSRRPLAVELTFNEITIPSENAAVFLSAYDWPFYTNPKPTVEQARNHLSDAPDTRTVLVCLDGVNIALLRLLELEDIGDGCPVFDLRVAPSYRGRGFGKKIVS